MFSIPETCEFNNTVFDNCLNIKRVVIMYKLAAEEEDKTKEEKTEIKDRIKRLLPSNNTNDVRFTFAGRSGE